MSMHQIRKKDIKELNHKLKEQNYDYALNPKSKVTLLDIDKYTLILQDDVPLFFSFKTESLYYPTLKLMLKKIILPIVMVDMGAVPFVTKGADIMRPGIVSYPPNLKEGDLVVIVDENHNKPLSISRLLFSSEQLNSIDKGKVLKNIHYINDSIWNMDFD